MDFYYPFVLYTMGLSIVKKAFRFLEPGGKSISMDNAGHTVQNIHDLLESYYKVARKRFVDTICMQGSDYHLLTSDESPLQIFGTAFVSNLSALQRDIIAG
jgi:hypothetical protein